MSLPTNFFIGRGGKSSTLVNGFGPEYDGWTGDRIAVASAVQGTTTGDGDWQGLQGHISHYLGYWLSAYNETSYNVWPNAGTALTSTSSSALTNYYNIGVRNIFSVSQGPSGRGVTIAYLGDETPVFVICLANFQALHFYHTNGTYIGSRDFSGTDVYDGSSYWNTEWTNVMYDGTGLLLQTRADLNKVFHVTLPSNTSLSNGCVQDYIWDKGTTLSNGGYGGAYLGVDTSGYRWIAFNESSGSSSGAIAKLTPISGSSGTMTLPQTSMSSANYSAMVDYKNRKLLFGAHNNNGVFYVFG